LLGAPHILHVVERRLGRTLLTAPDAAEPRLCLFESRHTLASFLYGRPRALACPAPQPPVCPPSAGLPPPAPPSPSRAKHPSRPAQGQGPNETPGPSCYAERSGPTAPPTARTRRTRQERPGDRLEARTSDAAPDQAHLPSGTTSLSNAACPN